MQVSSANRDSPKLLQKIWLEAARPRSRSPADHLPFSKHRFIEASRLFPEFGHFTFDIFIFVNFNLEKPDGYLGLFLHALRSKVVQVATLAFVLSKVVYFYKALLHQRLQTIVNTPQTYTQFASDVSLARSRIVF